MEKSKTWKRAVVISCSVDAVTVQFEGYPDHCALPHERVKGWHNYTQEPSQKRKKLGGENDNKKSACKHADDRNSNKAKPGGTIHLVAPAPAAALLATAYQELMQIPTCTAAHLKTLTGAAANVKGETKCETISQVWDNATETGPTSPGPTTNDARLELTPLKPAVGADKPAADKSAAHTPAADKPAALFLLPKPPLPLCKEFGERLLSLVAQQLELSKRLGNRSWSASRVTAKLLQTCNAGELLALFEAPNRLQDALAHAKTQLDVKTPRLHSPVSITATPQ